MNFFKKKGLLSEASFNSECLREKLTGIWNGKVINYLGKWRRL